MLACSGALLVRNGPLGTPAFVTLAYANDMADNSLAVTLVLHQSAALLFTQINMMSATIMY